MAYGSALSNIGVYFQTFGVMDFLLPFILVFTITFAVLKKSEILGKDSHNFNVVIALVLGLLFVAPHMTGNYPLGYDPVAVMNAALPSISLVSVSAIMLLLLMGVFGTGFATSAAPVIAVVAIGFVVYIFGASLALWTGPYQAFSWWTPETTELMIVLMIFGVIVWFITRDPTKPSTGMSDFFKTFAKGFEKK